MSAKKKTRRKHKAHGKRKTHRKHATKKRKRTSTKKEKSHSSSKLPLDQLRKIRSELSQGGSTYEQEAPALPKGAKKLAQQRMPVASVVKKSVDREKSKPREYILTGVPGFDDLFETGIPKGASILVAGGAGSGKTIMCLQTLNFHALQGKKCLYMSFEESAERLKEHMEDFGWNPDQLMKQNKLKIQRFNPFDITRNVDALLMDAKGELLIDIDPVILPKGFKPDVIVVDSLTAIASAFVSKEDSYRVYIEQLFRFFEKIQANAFLITETTQIPTIYSTSGVEEFLADGVIVLYNIKRGNVRENAIEVLKLRGADHIKKIVAFEITNGGMAVYPEQEIFGEIE